RALRSTGSIKAYLKDFGKQKRKLNFYFLFFGAPNSVSQIPRNNGGKGRFSIYYATTLHCTLSFDYSSGAFLQSLHRSAPDIYLSFKNTLPSSSNSVMSKTKDQMAMPPKQSENVCMIGG